MEGVAILQAVNAKYVMSYCSYYFDFISQTIR